MPNVPQINVPSGGAFGYAPTIDALADQQTHQLQLGSVAPQRGTLTQRPSAVTAGVGALYYATDVNLLYYSDGATWSVVTLNPNVSGGTVGAVTDKLGSLTILAHSYAAGATQADSGTSNVYQEGVTAKLQSLMKVEETNIMNVAQAGTRLTYNLNPLFGQPFAGWAAALQFFLPNNNVNINAATDVVISDPIVAVNGAFVILLGVNDYGADFNGAWINLAETNVNRAYAHALRTVLSRIRAGVVYGSTISNGVAFWDSSIAFGGAASTSVPSVTTNTGGAYRMMNVDGQTTTITVPNNFTGGTVAVCHIAQENAQGSINTVMTAGTAVISVNNWQSFPQSGTCLIKVDNEEMLVTAGLGSNAWAVTRGQNGTVAAAHAGGSLMSMATDAHRIDVSGTATGATGSIAASGQGSGNGNSGTGPQIGPAKVPVVTRYPLTAADAGKTLIFTYKFPVAGDTSAQIWFDSWWIETAQPPPTVLTNVQHYGFGNSAPPAEIARIANLNTVMTNVKAEFDQFVQIADVYTLWFNRNGTLQTSINNTDATNVVSWTANSTSFTPQVGQYFSFGGFGGEYVRITAVAGVAPNWTLTIARHQADTAQYAKPQSAHTAGAWMGPADYQHLDDLHLNVKGHSIFADTIYTAFNAMTVQSGQIAQSQGNWSQYSQRPVMGLIDNFYYYPAVNVMGTTAIALNTMTAHPIYIPKMCILTEIGVAATAVNAAPSTARFGIYLPDGTHSRPGNLLQELGTVTMSVSTNVAEVGCYQVLRPGWYWLAYVNQGGGGPSTVRTISTLGLSWPVIMSDATLGAAGITGVSVTGVTGALPNPFGIFQAVQTGGTARVHVRLRTPPFG